jgi:hypothetical protein
MKEPYQSLLSVVSGNNKKKKNSSKNNPLTLDFMRVE